METLEFKVTRQMLRLTSRPFTIVENSKDYLNIHLTGNSDWEVGTVTAFIHHEDDPEDLFYTRVLDDENKCDTPWEVIKKGTVTFSFECINGEIVITSYPCKIKIEQTNISEDFTITPSQTEYQQLINYFSETKETVENGINTIEEQTEACEQIKSDILGYVETAKEYSEDAEASREASALSAADAMASETNASKALAKTEEYENSARLYAEEAKKAMNIDAVEASNTSAINAKTSEENAKVSENNAKLYEDETKEYLDNAKGYLDIVEECSDNAKISETNSSVSEINSKTSETNSKVSEDNAKISEDNSKLSEENAKVSETNSKTSEDSSKLSETNAKVSEENAKESETKSKISETNSKTSELNAKVSETNSKESEINSKESEDKAKISETNAKVSEDNSKVSETNAKTSETNSGLSEANAKEYSDSASEYLESAKVSETNAKTSEVNAKTSEDNAKGYDDDANECLESIKVLEASARTSEANSKTSETNSKTSENNAKQYADSASESVTTINESYQNIIDTSAQSLTDISTAKTTAIQDIQTQETSSITKINSIANDFENTVDATATSAVETATKEYTDKIDVCEARMDNLIPSGTQTEGNTELLDIRVGADGTIYDGAGEAVRSQVSSLKETLADLNADVSNIFFVPNILDDSVLVEYAQINRIGARVNGTGIPGYFYIGKQKVLANKEYILYEKGKSIYFNRAVFYLDNKTITTSTSNGVEISCVKEKVGSYSGYKFTPQQDGYVAFSLYAASEIINVDISNFGLSLRECYDGTFYNIGERILNDETFLEYEKKSDLSTDVKEIISDSYEVKYPLENKTCYVLGDSIMAQGKVTSALKSITKMTITNYAIGGTRLGDVENNPNGTYGNAICYKCEQMADTLPDLILVEGGNNDCYYTPVGTVGIDINVTTVTGAVRTIIQKLETKYPGVPIVFSTMPFRWIDNQTYKKYAMIVEDTCKYYGIPVMNAWTSCGFNEFNKSQYCETDGIHVNKNGGYRMAKAWVEIIKTAMLN